MLARAALATALCLSGVVATAAPAQAAPAVKIAKIYYDSPGSDRGGNLSLNGEYVVLKNTTGSYRTITGWTVRDAAGHTYRFPTTRIAPYKAVTLRTGKGTNSATTRYWNRTWYVWNNDRDTATLRNGAGTVVHRCSYSSSAVDYKSC